MNVSQADPASLLISERFLEARRTAAGLSDFPGDLPLTLEDAYAIQDAAIAGWRKPVVGWKVGRINLPLSERFEADRLAGPIFSSRLMPSNGEVASMPVFAQGFAAGEAEFLLRIGRSPPSGKTEFTLSEVVDHIGDVHVGIEVASSPLKSINEIGPVAVISDFGNNNGVLIGLSIPNWRDSRFEEWPVTTLIDGRLVGSGKASAFPDGAIGAARFLFELMARRGVTLEAGQWISSGAVTGVHDAHSGQTVCALFDDRFKVECKLVAAQPEPALVEA